MILCCPNQTELALLLSFSPFIPFCTVLTSIYAYGCIISHDKNFVSKLQRRKCQAHLELHPFNGPKKIVCVTSSSLLILLLVWELRILIIAVLQVEYLLILAGYKASAAQECMVSVV